MKGYSDGLMNFGGLDRTPSNMTPYPYDDKGMVSVLRSPGHGGMSPMFTPFRESNNNMFTPVI